MNAYLFVKFLHILAVTLTIGGMFARQLVRGFAKKSDEINVVASLTRAAERMDRGLVVPGSSSMLVMGIVLAVMQKWPIFGFLQGASQNWLLVSNILLVIMIMTIPVVFVPHNKKVDSLLRAALSQGQITPELRSVLHDSRNRVAHHLEEFIVVVIAALMVLKPF